MPRAGCNSFFQPPSPVPRAAVSLELPPLGAPGSTVCQSGNPVLPGAAILTQFLEFSLPKKTIKQWDQALRVCRAVWVGMAAQSAGKALAGTGVGTKAPPVNPVYLQHLHCLTHRMTEWFGLEGTLQLISSARTPCTAPPHSPCSKPQPQTIPHTSHFLWPISARASPPSHSKSSYPYPT